MRLPKFAVFAQVVQFGCGDHSGTFGFGEMQGRDDLLGKVFRKIEVGMKQLDFGSLS